MKRHLIQMYYDTIMWLEDLFNDASTVMNNKRKKLEKKYWEKYIL